MSGLILITRASPDWETLASDYESGIPINPARYTPRNVAGFPGNIEALIRHWNETLPLNFFRCRQALKDIALRVNRLVIDSIMLSENDLARLPELIEERSVLFFHDDDDWFAPDAHDRISKLNFGGSDILVFPLPRFGFSLRTRPGTITFVRRFRSARVVVGARRNFCNRYQTNNYGIRCCKSFSTSLLSLKEHVDASHYADAAKLKDGYFDLIISATNKTPCSASCLSKVLGKNNSGSQNRRAVDKLIAGYVDHLQSLAIPEAVAWAKPAVAETSALFHGLRSNSRG